MVSRNLKQNKGLLVRRTQTGFALLLSIILSSILLSVGLTMLTITTKQLTLSGVARESEIAFQASAAGIECIQFHRLSNTTVDFVTRPSVNNPPNAQLIDCFGVPVTGTTADWNDGGNTNGYMNLFKYTFDWTGAGGARCTQIDLYVSSSTSNSNYTVDLTPVSEAVGSRTCSAGVSCSVGISRGYNRSCVDVSNGLATVQRELTAQF